MQSLQFGPPQSTSVSPLLSVPSEQVAAQRLPRQLPPTQSLPVKQILPAAHLPQAMPPQSVSLSVPFFTLSEHVGASHMLDVQILSLQSAPFVHISPVSQPPHEPPQSTSVSVPFCTP